MLNAFKKNLLAKVYVLTENKTQYTVQHQRRRI